jgi:hypothetical protein
MEPAYNELRLVVSVDHITINRNILTVGEIRQADGYGTKPKSVPVA